MRDPFLNDDAGYLLWLAHHPNGYVINCAHPPNASYIVLHRADCHTISGQPASGSSWTTAYQKLCADTVAELDSWAMAEAGATPTRCGTCQP